jgi:hypothetical protein
MSSKMRIALIVAILIISSRLLAAPIIYGFSSGILPSETQEFVYRGFLLGLNNFKKIDPERDLKLVYSNSGSLTSPVEVAKEVLKETPKIITGFPSSFESQLAAPVLKESGILTFFASSSNLSLENMGHNIYSSSESILVANSNIAKEIEARHKNDPGVVIYNPFDYFSVNQQTTWKMILGEKSGLNLKFLATAADGKLPVLSKEECKAYKYVITTLFPSKSYEFFRFFDENNIDVPVYTNSSWYKMEFTLLKRFFSKKKTPVYQVQFKDFNKEIAAQIGKTYRQKYKSAPSPEVFVGYDLGIIVGSVLEKSKDLKITPNEVMKTIPCFEGSPFGKVCFGGKGGFAPREVLLVNINERK